MPRVSEHKEHALRRTIRDIIALDPLIPINALQRAVEAKIKRPIDEVYLNKLVRKNRKELMVSADREKVEERVAQIRETHRIVKEELLRIAFPSSTLLVQPTISERIKALNTIQKMDKDQIKIEMDLGIFSRKLGEVDIVHRLKPIDDNTRASMINAWKLWVESPMEMRKVKFIEVKNATATTKQTRTQTAVIAKPKSSDIVTDAGLVPTE